MPVFKCEECNCVENTATGQYWSRNHGVYPPPYHGRALCSECGSPKFVDGTPTEFGQWHGRFPKEDADLPKFKDTEFLN